MVRVASPDETDQFANVTCVMPTMTTVATMGPPQFANQGMEAPAQGPVARGLRGYVPSETRIPEPPPQPRIRPIEVRVRHMMDSMHREIIVSNGVHHARTTISEFEIRDQPREGAIDRLRMVSSRLAEEVIRQEVADRVRDMEAQIAMEITRSLEPGYRDDRMDALRFTTQAHQQPCPNHQNTLENIQQMNQMMERNLQQMNQMMEQASGVVEYQLGQAPRHRTATEIEMLQQQANARAQQVIMNDMDQLDQALRRAGQRGMAAFGELYHAREPEERFNCVGESEAELRAQELLRELIGDREVEKYRRHGWLYVRGTLNNYLLSNRRITGEQFHRRIPLHRPATLRVYKMCVHLRAIDRMPPTDNIIALRMALLNDEENILEMANEHGYETMRRLPPAACRVRRAA
jgi:hypothetical protein